MAETDCSIILPTLDRPRDLQSAFDSLRQLDTKGCSWEILVIDDGGSCDPMLVLRAYQGIVPFRVLYQYHAGPAAARNHGVRHARGRLLLFMDDDCRPGPAWLKAFLSAHAKDPESLLGGTTYNALPENCWSTASELVVAMARSYYNRQPVGPCFFPSNNMAAPAGLFRELGGFDPGYVFASEDRDLCDRWRHAGLPLREVPEARILHAHPLMAGTFVRRHFSYGQGAWRYHSKRRQRGSGRLSSDLRFYLRLPNLFSRLAPQGGHARMLVPLFLWQVANTLGFLAAALGSRLAGPASLRFETPVSSAPPRMITTSPVELTVAIPTWNGAERLPGLLAALKAQRAPGRSWEVLVVDNDSTDRTTDLVQEYGPELLAGVALRRTREPLRGIGYARQRAVEEALGKRIAFLDDDTRPASDWVEQALSFLDGRPGVAALSGRIRPCFGGVPPAGFERIASFFALFDHGDQPRPYDASSFDLPPGAGLIVDRKAWLRHVPPVLRQATGPGDDFEALLHIHSAGGEIWYHPGLQLEHVIAPYRLEPTYLATLMRECGRCVCRLRLVGIRGFQRPIVVAKVVVGSLIKLLRLTASRAAGADLVTRCELLFWWHATLSPVELLRKPSEVPLPQRMRLRNASEL